MTPPTSPSAPGGTVESQLGAAKQWYNKVLFITDCEKCNSNRKNCYKTKCPFTLG